MDSGVGGISVLGELVKCLPGENFIYLGDTKNAPYGAKTAAEVLALTRGNLERLVSMGAKAFVIACNTATAAAAAALRAENPGFPIIGIEPAVKPAAGLGGHPRVLVMATPLTLTQPKYQLLAQRYAEAADYYPLACPGLVELIEAGEWDTPRLHDYLSALFSEVKDLSFDAVVLGCTHYPHIKEALAAHFPAGTVFLDGGAGTARETARRLAEQDLLQGKNSGGTVTYIFTEEGKSARAREQIARRLMQKMSAEPSTGVDKK